MNVRPSGNTHIKAWALGGLLIMAMVVGVWYLRSEPAVPNAGSQVEPTAPSAAVESQQPEATPAGTAHRASAAAAPSSTASLEQVLSQAGYYPALTQKEDRDAYLQLDTVGRILTPTSLKDVEWMRGHRYPKRQDVESPDFQALERTLATAHPIRDPAYEYAANVLAAYYYQRGDPRWRDYARMGLGPFAGMLEAWDARDQFERGEIRFPRLQQAVFSVMAQGELNATQLLRGLTRPLQPHEQMHQYATAPSSLQTAMYLQFQLRDRERQYGTVPPWTPRPPPPWDPGPHGG